MQLHELLKLLGGTICVQIIDIKETNTKRHLSEVVKMGTLVSNISYKDVRPYDYHNILSITKMLNTGNTDIIRIEIKSEARSEDI